MYDQRLFNQEGGMASGLAAEDTYNLYDKPMFADRGSNLYRPRGTEDAGEDGTGENARRFRPDKVQDVVFCCLGRCVYLYFLDMHSDLE